MIEGESDRRSHWLVTRACHELKRFLDRSPDFLPTLARVPIAGQARDRSMYIDRREACVTVLQRLLRHIDLVSMRVSVQGNDVIGIKLATIAEDAGLDDRRVDRAIRDLRDAGILTSFRRQEGDQRTGYIGRTSVRRISEALFGALGLGAKLAKVRLKLSAARREAKTNADPVKRANVSLALKATGMAKRPAAGLRGDAMSLGDALRRPPPPRKAP